ncbi:Sensor kinase CckA [subsurface metagenome]
MICQKLERRVDLVITDIIMPHMSGVELIEKLNETWPDLKVLYMSGYPENAIAHHGVLDPGIPYIQKSCRPVDIALKVWEILDS